jgi:hypothetical protein
VRHFRLPRIEQFLRITIGTDDECATLLAALHELIAPPPPPWGSVPVTPEQDRPEKVCANER